MAQACQVLSPVPSRRGQEGAEFQAAAPQGCIPCRKGHLFKAQGIVRTSLKMGFGI